MSVNSSGEINNSIPSSCVNYQPIMDKKKDVRCSILGQLYECKNFITDTNFKSGCLFCLHQSKKCS